jgi:gas vesicle protein
MFRSEHSCKDLLIGAFVGGTLGIVLATLLFNTAEGKKLQKVFMHKLQDLNAKKDTLMSKGKKVLKARNKIKRKTRRAK